MFLMSSGHCLITLDIPFSWSGKKCSKAPKIQRLVTPLTLQRKRARIAEKKKRIAKAKSEAAEYHKLLATRLKEQRERRSESLAKKRSRLSAASKPSAAAWRVSFVPVTQKYALQYFCIAVVDLIIYVCLVWTVLKHPLMVLRFKVVIFLIFVICGYCAWVRMKNSDGGNQVNRHHTSQRNWCHAHMVTWWSEFWWPTLPCHIPPWWAIVLIISCKTFLWPCFILFTGQSTLRQWAEDFAVLLMWWFRPVNCCTWVWPSFQRMGMVGVAVYCFWNSLHQLWLCWFDAIVKAMRFGYYEILEMKIPVKKLYFL